MTTARFLMIASKTLVGVALVTHMFLPITFDMAFHVSDRNVGIPIRWFITAALLKMGWTLAHVSISR